MSPSSTPLIDVAAERSATPHCEPRAFLLSAGSSLPTRTTLDAVIAHLHREAEIGGYAAADEAQPTLAACRSDLATLVGGTGDEVALTTSDTAAWVKAWWGWVLGGNVRPGSVVLIDRLSYHSHYASLVQTQGISDFEIRLMPTLPDGTVNVAELHIDDGMAAICATMIGTHSGNVNPIAAIGAAARAAGVPLFVDGCQAIGQLVIDVHALGCQVFTGTGRKFLRGPRGTGFAWVSSSIVDRFQPPGIDGTSTDWEASTGLRVHPGVGRFEEYETSYASMVGMAAAARHAVGLSMAAVESRVTALAERLRNGLSSIGGVTVHDLAAQRCAIVTFTLQGVEPSAVVRAAADDGIVINESSATWAALDLNAKGLERVVRASPHYFNTDDEVDRLVDVIERLSGRS
jgi:cysteine desulfurase / selenocysteine lyase